MKTVTFSLKNGNRDMYKEIETSLIEMEGIERALIDVNDGDLKVEFNEDRVGTNQVREVIEGQGAQIKEIKE
ncbi:hypothetical protein WQ54_19915 [Bacillus sp. SA1-12]|uniref:hypothetical protein n=1 Tax=Bacillus sp. SA1-12 TaxID=1455638 RepID=UPI000626F605|nr:hypothetical protein [Bacillus sp. SA1-12]KKI90248.1 hypothetical protein WQ54_19915 [Bacillus sp. SA1-12]